MSLRADKRAMRRSILALRDALSPVQRARHSAGARERLLGMDLFQEAGTVHTFVPFGSELDTRPILQDLWRRGRRVVLPRVVSKGRLEHLAVEGWHELAPGAWDIPEPVDGCPAVSPTQVDLILVPGVAFDRQGGRLGYGGGFYDRFLASCPAPRVALAFHLQVVDRVPREGHDLKVHRILTEAEEILVPG